MSRFSKKTFDMTLTMITALLSPEIAFWVQLYFLSKDSHGDVDIFVHEMHRDAIRAHFAETLEKCPNGDKNRDKVVVIINNHEGSNGVNVTVEFKYSQHPEESAFAGSYGGIFHILVLHSIRAMYGKNMSIVDGHVVLKEGKVVVPIMTLQDFLKQHNFELHATQDHAFNSINDFFEAWSKSTCFVPSAFVQESERPKTRDERVLGMYGAFTAWLTSNGLSKEKLLEEPLLTQEQCQQNAEKTFPEACRRLPQALDAEKEAEKMVMDAKKVATVSSIVDSGVIGAIHKTQYPLVGSVSRFILGTQNKEDIKCATCKKCIALHGQFKAMHGGGDIFVAITKTRGKKEWEEFVKRMWTVYNSTPTTTQEEEN
jgi:hypothetical protein